MASVSKSFHAWFDRQRTGEESAWSQTSIVLEAQVDGLVVISDVSYHVPTFINIRFLLDLAVEYDTEVQAIRSRETTTRAEVEGDVHKRYTSLQHGSSGRHAFAINEENDKKEVSRRRWRRRKQKKEQAIDRADSCGEFRAEERAK